MQIALQEPVLICCRTAQEAVGVRQHYHVARGLRRKMGDRRFDPIKFRNIGPVLLMGTEQGIREARSELGQTLIDEA